MTETFVAIIAMMAALMGAFGTAVVMTAAFTSVAGLAKGTGFVELRSRPKASTGRHPESALLNGLPEPDDRRRV